MKSGLQMIVGLGVAALVLSSPATRAAALSDSTNTIEKLSYSIGMSVGTSIKRGGFEVDPKLVGDAIRDVLSGAEPKLTEAEAQQTIMSYQQELRAKREQERVKLAETNRLASERFLAANKQKAGVKVHPVKISEGNTAELQYKVLAEGSGESPRAEDRVTFNYTVTTIDGKEIDSTAKRGQPMKTVLNHYRLAGVKEALLNMKPGAKWQLFVPATLAFGDMGDGQNVQPGSAVVYEVELVDVETVEPLTSDIIKVPSKEELDRGAKIEVIKPEDVKRMQQTNSASGSKK
jgi:FKBP-type peptidyl-prolyl cis-trans isomerase FklB